MLLLSQKITQKRQISIYKFKIQVLSLIKSIIDNKLEIFFYI